MNRVQLPIRVYSCDSWALSLGLGSSRLKGTTSGHPTGQLTRMLDMLPNASPCDYAVGMMNLYQISLNLEGKRRSGLQSVVLGDWKPHPEVCFRVG